ncbi:LysR family transcriptional regulator [Rhizobium sp. SL42]|uniref:LysR family transcriptional regulator n=1 Tax=Rhizobium sp. SL42 TaxID=2806346 RepID=UPI001F3E8FC5|nr:LysR family transcriptional regulator [Rhizobium sp. SL42]UJW76779.1 LysR family transcriptional regulator [Rhizobium sp. SL42]
MDASQIIELLAFQAVARHRNFGQAAIERGMTKSAISHAIRRLETRLDLRLFHRTTRSVSLSEPGAKLFAELTPALDGVDLALEQLNQFRGGALGTVRLNVPSSLAPFVVIPMLDPLLRDNPGLHLDIVATDRLIDIVEEGFDAGIRLSERLSQDMIAVKIGAPLRFAVVASPEYSHRRGMPQTPHELADHACIRYRFLSGSLFHWEFERDGQALSVEVQGPLTFDSQLLMVESALAGHGLAYVWEPQVRQHLTSGSLVQSLEDWCPLIDDLFVYYPSRRHMSAGLRVVIDALKATRKA